MMAQARSIDQALRAQPWLAAGAEARAVRLVSAPGRAFQLGRNLDLLDAANDAYPKPAAP
jgi:hypothetical protein